MPIRARVWDKKKDLVKGLQSDVESAPHTLVPLLVVYTPLSNYSGSISEIS